MDFNGLLDLFFQRQCDQYCEEYSWNPEPDTDDDEADHDGRGAL